MPNHNCTPLLDWAGGFGHRAHLEADCQAVTVTVDTWPLHKPWPAGPVPGGDDYDAYRRIVQGPLAQIKVTLRPGWTAIGHADVTAPGCAAQIDVAYLVDGQPFYREGVTVQGTPDYGPALLPGGAWVVDATCTPTPTPTTSTTVPTPAPTTTTRPAIVCPVGICDTATPPPTTTTSTTQPDPTPTLPETGAYAGVMIGAALLGIIAGAALVRTANRLARKANR